MEEQNDSSRERSKTLGVAKSSILYILALVSSRISKGLEDLELLNLFFGEKQDQPAAGNIQEQEGQIRFSQKRSKKDLPSTGISTDETKIYLDQNDGK